MSLQRLVKKIIRGIFQGCLAKHSMVLSSVNYYEIDHSALDYNQCKTWLFDIDISIDNCLSTRNKIMEISTSNTLSTLSRIRRRMLNGGA